MSTVEQDLSSAREAYERGDYETAAAVCASLAAAAPQEIEPRFLRGVCLFQLGRYADAEQELSTVIQHEPHRAAAWKYRGGARRLSGLTKEAFADLNTAIRLADEDAESWYERGQARRIAGDLVGAVDDLTKAVELDPRSARAYWGRGYIRGDLDDHAGAVDDFTRYLEFFPNDADARLNRGWSLRRLQRFDEALVDLNRAAELAPQSAKIFWNRGDVFQDQSRWNEALTDYRRATTLEPNSTAPLLPKIRELETMLGLASPETSPPPSTATGASPLASAVAPAAPAPAPAVVPNKGGSERFSILQLIGVGIAGVILIGMGLTFVGLLGFAVIKGIDVLYAGSYAVQHVSQEPTSAKHTEYCKSLFCRRTDTAEKHISGSQGRQSEKFISFCPQHRRSEALVFLDLSHAGTLMWYAYCAAVWLAACLWLAAATTAALGVVSAPLLVLLDRERRSRLWSACAGLGITIGLLGGTAIAGAYAWW